MPVKKINLLQIFLATGLLLGSAVVHAQDVFRSVGNTTKSYRYIEAQYQFDTGVDNPYTLAGYYSIADNIALRFSYFRVSFLVNVDTLPVNAALETTWIGAVYYRPFNFSEDSSLGRILDGADWIVGLDLGRERLSGRFINNGVPDSVAINENVQQLFLGLRKSIGPKLEIQGGFNSVIGSDLSNERIDLLAVYRVGRFLDAAIGFSDVGESDTVGVGLRYTW